MDFARPGSVLAYASVPLLAVIAGSAVASVRARSFTSLLVLAMI